MVIQENVSWVNHLGLDCGPTSSSYILAKTKILRVEEEPHSENCLIQFKSRPCAMGVEDFRFVPGSYRLQSLSSTGKEILQNLGIDYELGKDFPAEQIVPITKFYIEKLEKMVQGHMDENRVLTYSGKVGRLLYNYVTQKIWPTVTYFGDLSVDLAQEITRSQVLNKDLKSYIPTGNGPTLFLTIRPSKIQ